MYQMCVKCILTQNFTSICTLFVPRTMEVPIPFESESMSLIRFEPWPRRLFAVFLLSLLCFFPFFSFNLHSSSKNISEVFRVKRTCENAERDIFYVQIDNNIKMRRWDLEQTSNLTGQDQKWMRRHPVRFAQWWPVSELNQDEQQETLWMS